MHRHPSGPPPNAALRRGLDFATRDYLALASHPALGAAARPAEAQDPAGNEDDCTTAVPELQDRLARFVGFPTASCFASGTEAIHHTLLSLLRPEDHVIVDAGASPALFDAVTTAGAQLHRSPPASVEGIERRLARLARQSGRGRLVIATTAVSATTSRVADLAEISALARTHAATFVVDVSNDLGAMGPSGGGIAEIQSCNSRIDILLGSFSRTFGATGGFAAFRDPTLSAVQTAAAPLSHANAAVILAALHLIAGAEGQRRRRNLHGLSLRLRNHLMADGVKVMGKASPFVPILLPPSTALARTALLQSAGPMVQLLQAPLVPRHAPRWRIQLSAAHGPADIDDLSELIRDVTRAFARSPALTSVPA
ncbi:MAG TPA: pyridoxal phosphate-dependent aminotransferase family protein [Tabrizicola sp.]|nr:pyridoxal phosphate-dependent aminotransferase family protein [Tabrizicola sp.]